MKTATVGDLRNNFSKLEGWLAEGEEIRIEKRGLPVAKLTALSAEEGKRKFVKPDFRARLQRLWGDRVFSAEDVKAMRDAEFEGEEG